MNSTSVLPRLVTNSQQVLIDLQGHILESDDCIFSTLELRHEPVSDWCPFMESVFPAIVDLKMDIEEIYFPCIHYAYEMIDGIFDVAFMRVQWCGEPIIVWSIFDKTTHYLALQAQQQKIYESLLFGDNH